MQLFRHDFGTVLAIGIQDESIEVIIHEHDSFWNHQATSGEPNWLNDKFCYFWTKPTNLKFAIVERCLFRLLRVDFGRSKGKYRGLMPEAIKLAEIELNSIKPELFLGAEHNEPELAYKFGYLEYMTPDLTGLTNERYSYLTSAQ